jgi:outer membrane protein assembly factor BamA
MNKAYFYNYKYLLFAIVIVIANSSCDTLKYISKEEAFLDENEINFINDDHIEDKGVLEIELENLYRQKPNTEFVFVPRRWHWYRNQNEGDTTWFKKWVKKSIAEPPAIYSQDATNQTASNMQKYLQFKKGYYLAEVEHKVNIKYQKARVKYIVNTGPQYKVKTVNYLSDDNDLLRIIEDSKDQSLVNEGSPVESALFDRERSRIATLLQNKGYANFNINYVEMLGDSNDLKFDVFFQIQKPAQDSIHRKYSIGEIHVYTDRQLNKNIISADSILLDSKYFHREGDDFLVRPNAILGAIYLNEGDIYQKDLVNKTYRKLSNLGPYRFISIIPEIDLEVDSVINYDITLSPNPNNWVADFGSEFFYSTLSQIGRNLFGFSANAQFQNNNFFGGAEKFTIGLESGLEFDISELKTNALSFSYDNILEVPRLIDMWGTFGLLNKLNLVSDKNYATIKDETSSNFSLGYNFNKLLDFYTIHSFNLTMGYDIQPAARKRYILDQIGLNLWLPETEERFDTTILKDNPLLQNSFSKRLFTGLFFRDFTFIYQSRTSPKGISKAFIGNFELSGHEIFLANKLSNAISGSNKDWKLGNIEFGKYAKLDLDGRLYKTINSRSSIASRINLGFAVPFGDNSVVPYVKQFYAGGPNSIRGWQIRELGPGSYSTLLIDPVDGQAFFQSGDIKIEFNLEYRFDLFWVIEGALFLDAGNVWTFKNDTSRVGAQFNSSFYKDIAVGTGFGIRWDFNYFLIRFDLGYRIKNSYLDPDTGNYWPYKNFKDFRITKANLNVAVNYPF